MGVEVSQNGTYALQLLAEFTSRPSKRLRGMLAVIAYEMFGGANHLVAIDLALAMELAQSYLLIVDDVIDHSLTRRGGPTVNREYARMMHCDYPGKSLRHEADMVAIVIGELAQHLASAVLNGIDAPAARIIKVEQLFHTNLAATGHGQIDDLLGSLGQPHNIAETLAVYLRKTCYYTFINPLQTGAALAGAGKNDLAVLYEFGKYAGIAFQLQDDDIGMFGDERSSGKSNLDDLREGKMTVLVRHALTHANETELAVLGSALGNRRVTREQHKAVQAIFERVGSRAFTIKKIRWANAKAKMVLNAQNRWDLTSRASLAVLLDSLIRRKV